MRDSWLDPNGKLIEVGEFQHNSYASDLLEEEMGLEGLHAYMNKNRISYPYEVLHERGWVRVKFNNYSPKVEVCGGCINLVRPMRNTIDPPMNERQMKVVMELCELYDTSFHKAINDKRFW